MKNNSTYKKYRRTILLFIMLASGLTIIYLNNYKPKPGINPQYQTNTKAPAPQTPNRIVSLAPNLTEILFELGLGQNITAATQYSNYPPKAQNIPRIGSFWQADIEKIIEKKPDLVITLAFKQQTDLAKRLNKLNIKTLTVKIDNISELFSAITEIAQRTNTKNKGRLLIQSIENQINQIAQKIPDSPPLSVLWVVQRKPLRVAGPDTFVTELMQMAGAVNAIEPTIHKYPPIGTEELIIAAPQIIIEPAKVKDIDSQLNSAIQFWNKLPQIPAVKNQRIYVIPGDSVSRLGPRLPQAMKNIAKCIWPEAFRNQEQN